jgi:hypothetical protein
MYNPIMDINPYESPESVNPSPKQKSSWFKSYLFLGFTGVVVLILLIGLLLPASRGSREAGRRAQCMNKLHQIGLALLNYESVHHCFPPAFTVDAAGKPLHSWRTLILPFLDQKDIYEHIDLSKPWNDPVNKAACETPLKDYSCPSSDAPANYTQYLAVVAPSGFFQPNQPRKRSEVLDNPDLTLMIVEVDSDHAVPWMSPADASEPVILNLRSAAKLPHPAIINALFVNGAVRPLSVSEITEEELKAMISIAGNDDAIARKAVE